MIKKNFLVLTYLLFSYNTISCTLYESISKENIKSLSSQFRPSRPDFTSYESYLQWTFKQQKELDPHKKRSLAFTLLQELEATNPITYSSILDYTTWKDLNLFYGPPSNRSSYLASHIDRTGTEIGRVMLFGMLANPTTNIQVLRDRQLLIQEFIQNKKLYSSGKKIIAAIKKSENLLYSLGEADTFSQAALRKETIVPYQPAIIDEINKNSVLVELRERFEEASLAAQLGSMTAGALLLPTTALLLVARYTNKADSLLHLMRNNLGVSPIVGFFSLVGFSSWLISQTTPNRFTKSANHALTGFNYGTLLYNIFDQCKANIRLLMILQEKVMAATHLITALKELELVSNTYPILKQKLTQFHAITQLLQVIPEQEPEFKKLLELLNTSTFTGEPSFFSRAGRILVAHKLLTNYKQYLTKALVIIGELDVYLSLAQLMQERNQTKNTWCFPYYISHEQTSATTPNTCHSPELSKLTQQTYQSQEPFIRSKDFWNPFLDPNKAISNSITLNSDTNPRTIIITGPNAGGKSTTMKAIALSLVLAQTISIAPAQTLSFTPFNNIMTYLTITDDIAAGNSHFKAGVLRAQELVSMAKNLPSNHYGFIAIDELFNGTTYHEGQAAAYSLIEFLGKFTNILCTTATHFPLITTLEQKSLGTLFKNYKVTVRYTNNNTIEYPFILEPGIAHQSAALDILRQEGFDNEFLTQARAIIDNHQTA